MKKIKERQAGNGTKPNVRRSNGWRVMLLKNHNVVHEERYGTWFRCFLMGCVWRYIPDFTFKKRRFMIVDA